MELERVIQIAERAWNRYQKEGGLSRRRALSSFRRACSLAKQAGDWKNYTRALQGLSSVLLSYDVLAKIYEAKQTLEEGISLLASKGLEEETFLLQISLCPVLLKVAEAEPLKPPQVLKEGLSVIHELLRGVAGKSRDYYRLKLYQGMFCRQLSRWDREERSNLMDRASSCFLEVESSSEEELVRDAKFQHAIALLEENVPAKAESLLKESSSLAVKTGCERDMGEICELLSDLCEKRGDYKQANYHLRQAINYWQRFGRPSRKKREHL